MVFPLEPNYTAWSQRPCTEAASASEMTYIVSGGALNSTHSLTEAAYPGPYLTAHRVSLEDVIS